MGFMFMAVSEGGVKGFKAYEGETKNESIVFLVDAGKAQKSVGPKAANLGSMMSAGFPVPDGFAVPERIYYFFLNENGLKDKIQALLDGTDFNDSEAVAACSKAIKEMIIGGVMSERLLNDIRDAIAARNENGLWAVRSSAVAEDLPEASFAGQQDTFLNTPKEDVPAAVRKCWASYWNERALSYRYDNGMPQFESGIAVIVQRMVDARISGVMFTADPVGEEDAIIIESSWGLGESIVSGIVSPDRYVCDRTDFRVRKKKINKKSKGIFLSDGGKVIDIEESRQALPSLTEEEAKGLAANGKRIEKHFGSPQDIEWAIADGNVFILQSRPITTLDKGKEVLWTRAYGDEYWADVTSPLFFSLLGDWLSTYVLGEGNQIMGYKELRDKPLLKLHKGHIYFNSEVLEIVFTFNPRFSRTKELLNYFPEKDQQRIGDAKTKIFRRLWAEVRIALLDRDGMITRTNDAYLRWAADYLKKMQAFDTLDLTKLDDKELYEEYVKMVGAFVKHYRLIRYGMVTHSIGTNLMVKRWLYDWLDDRSGTLYSRIISGLPENKTIQTNIAISRVAKCAREDEKVRSLLEKESTPEFLRKLKEDPALEKFAVEFNRLLGEYGHRSHTREIYFPRWVDDPSLIIDVLKALVPTAGLDMEKMEADKIRERQETEKAIAERVGKLKYGFVKKPVFNVVMRYAQVYLIFRENQRFYLDHILYRIRRLFMEYGRRYAERGLIGKREDIFFLSKEEIFDIASKDVKPDRRIIEERVREFDKYRDVLPSKFLRGKIEFDDTVIRDKNVMKITGTSASPGIATGTVRVVESIRELSGVESGEVLVTSNTDPGWTPVFSKLGGLITETGGILSHGAVVSREYGIPAVTGVKNAKRLLKTGQKITIDGNEGVIYIMEEKK